MEYWRPRRNWRASRPRRGIHARHSILHDVSVGLCVIQEFAGLHKPDLQRRGCGLHPGEGGAGHFAWRTEKTFGRTLERCGYLHDSAIQPEDALLLDVYDRGWACGTNRGVDGIGCGSGRGGTDDLRGDYGPHS